LPKLLASGQKIKFLIPDWTYFHFNTWNGGEYGAEKKNTAREGGREGGKCGAAHRRKANAEEDGLIAFWSYAARARRGGGCPRQCRTGLQTLQEVEEEEEEEKRQQERGPQAA